MITDRTLPPNAFAAMGTVVSVRAGGSDVVAARATAVAASVFERWDRRCSLYRPDSELSRVARGELALIDASVALRDAYALAVEWRGRTGGAFTPHRADGVIDLNGVVKALAIAEAGEAIAAMGVDEWGVDAGGDVLVSGVRADGSAWIIGIVDPRDPRTLLASMALGGGGARRAVATSGTAERGDHIWSPTDVGDASFVQVSVAAGDIVTADIMATAIVAGGVAALDEATGREQIDVLAVRRDGTLLATPGWPRAATNPRVA
ncbi:thiamine biosynthesis lipoprotein [Agromyces sp. 3263]|uniref:FAD:protein FMN transferase n=1 Tax=Agromyces sp. 3263 TaxID=2817750 RepID=UPI00285506E6|nr:FAD:protein FMN transferase [Agromyces sp. 3263]MDR6906759.1 thiamine biosynthesis lipoprotein [Agromyces sp. 3263]